MSASKLNSVAIEKRLSSTPHQESDLPQKKVLVVERIFSLYRKPVFDLVNQKVDLKVFFGKNKSGIRTAQTEYSESIPSFQYLRNDTSVLLFPIRKLLKNKPQVVIFDLAIGILNLPFIILICKLLGIKIAFWSHGYNRKIGFHPEKRLSDKYRLFLWRLVNANIVYGHADKRILQKYLSKKEVFVAPNTLDTPTLLKIKEKLQIEGKAQIRKRLNIKHKFNIVFIGRMLASKRPELLIDIYSILKSRYNLTLGIHFIGDGEMLQPIKERVRLNVLESDFYFHGPLYDDEKNGELLFISDLMIMPGDLGLSVNHAFCFGCPVVSFKRKNGIPAHGPEVEYVVNNKTGFLIEDSTPEAMAATINDFIRNNTLKEEFQKNIAFTVENIFPLEKMVGGVLDCIDYLTKGQQNLD